MNACNGLSSIRRLRKGFPFGLVLSLCAAGATLLPASQASAHEPHPLSGYSPVADPECLPDVVAMVHGSPISGAELVRRVRAEWEDDGWGAPPVDAAPPTIDDYRRNLMALIDERVLLKEARRLGLAAPEPEKRLAVQNLMAQIERQQMEHPDHSLEIGSETRTILAAELSRQLDIQALLDTELRPRVEVSEVDFERFTLPLRPLEKADPVAASAGGDEAHREMAREMIMMEQMASEGAAYRAYVAKLAASADLTMMLPDAHLTIQGYVTNRDLAAQSGITVLAISAGQSSLSEEGAKPVISAVTDTTGRFELRCLQPGALVLRFGDEQGSQLTRQVHVHYDPRSNREPATVQLDPVVLELP